MERSSGFIRVLLPIAALLLFDTIACHSRIGAAEPDGKAPIGPVELQLVDGSRVGGVLLDITDTEYTIHTSGGVQRFIRKRVLKLTPVDGTPDRAVHPVPADADAADDPPASKPVNLAPKDKGGESRERELIGQLSKPPAGDMPPMPKSDVKSLPASGPKPFARTVYHTDKSLPKFVQLALDKLENGAYAGAAEDFRNLLSNGSEEELAAGESLIQERLKKPLRNIMVLCYMQIQCVPCKATGMALCERCCGSGHMVLMRTLGTGGPAAAFRKGGDTLLTGLQGSDGSKYRFVEVCGVCKGNGYDVCTQCMGTRLGFVRPTIYEREAYANEFLRLAAEAVASGEANFGDTSREAPKEHGLTINASNPLLDQVYLADSAYRVKSDLMRMWRVEGYYMLALKADPMVILRADRNIQVEITKIRLRRINLYGELSQRQNAAGKYRND